ncbi:site-specific DNA-methyltransferase, partial [candidate division KSB1 bacterium]|nr:site-specific DNA-methyltransferase [candidate division KSB1 bacterium]
MDSVVTDPPYHLSEGWATWDGGDIAFQTALWVEVIRVLKPGGYILSFSSCRTYHRMACAMEDAGFRVHPMLAWVFGSGFPKATSISKQIDKKAGAEREAVSKVTKGRRPDPYFVGLRKEYQITSSSTELAKKFDGWYYGGQSLKPAFEPIFFGQKPFSEKTGAENAVKHGVGGINIDACRIPYEPDYRNSWGSFVHSFGRWPTNLILSLPVIPGATSEFLNRIFYVPRADSDCRVGSRHPTVKPLDLIRYLVRLITPAKGICLDLFAGTGTLGEAAFREGFSAILIEREAEYLSDIERRMALVLEGPM